MDAREQRGMQIAALRKIDPTRKSKCLHYVDGAKRWPSLSMRINESPRLGVNPGVMTSVGCYQLEGLGVHLMTRIDGDYFAILGLPLLAVLDFLRSQGALRA